MKKVDPNGVIIVVVEIVVTENPTVISAVVNC
jgi:hypothetical protein